MLPIILVNMTYSLLLLLLLLLLFPLFLILRATLGSTFGLH
jgi:hypothetical protein